jgi:hypothetical protein
MVDPLDRIERSLPRSEPGVALGFGEAAIP